VVVGAHAWRRFVAHLFPGLAVVEFDCLSGGPAVEMPDHVRKNLGALALVGIEHGLARRRHDACCDLGVRTEPAVQILQLLRRQLVQAGGLELVRAHALLQAVGLLCVRRQAAQGESC
jgi:hypothetical protein